MIIEVWPNGSLARFYIKSIPGNNVNNIGLTAEISYVEVCWDLTGEERDLAAAEYKAQLLADAQKFSEEEANLITDRLIALDSETSRKYIGVTVQNDDGSDTPETIREREIAMCIKPNQAKRRIK